MKQYLVFPFLFFVLSTDSLLAETQTGPLGWGQATFTQEMETDRPDFTEGTQTVQSGHLQFEIGYTFTYDSETGDETTSHTAPEFLLRAGLMDDLELRIGWEGYFSEEVEIGTATTDTDGTTDMSVGFKHHMYNQDGLLPDLSIILELGPPVGDKDLTANEVEPAAKLLWAHTLDHDLSIGGNINFATLEGELDRYLEISSSVALGYALNDKIGSYIEYFGLYPAESVDPETSTHFLAGGFTYAITEDLQLDIRTGFGINAAADDLFSGVGISVRI